MKAIFGKLGVSSRPELTALLLDQLLANTTGPAAEIARQPPASQA